MKADTAKISALFALWAIIFYPVYPALFSNWLGMPNSDNSYCLLVPFISSYFAWQKKDELKEAATSSSSSGLAIMVVSSFVYLVSYAGGIVVVQRLMIVLLLIGLVLYILGNQIFSILRFPLLFLFFMVPVPESVIGMVSFPLQTYATIVSSAIIQLCGIPVYREGHMLYFTQTQLEVAEACSGIRSISALLMLSVIFMSQCRNNNTLKTVIIISSVGIAFVANIIRVSGTGILAHFFGDSVARGFLHEFSGMAVFAVGFAMMFVEYKLLNRIWTLK